MKERKKASAPGPLGRMCKGRICVKLRVYAVQSNMDVRAAVRHPHIMEV